jgi:hypothetical protein
MNLFGEKASFCEPHRKKPMPHNGHELNMISGGLP